ncbi:hypothetical protein OPKNFCMD_3762 [Methylobacterium crusticola]|uniref:L,D-TPase catalytic domain-containing protein n=1 Tax=Methylobacterium crusticola TaxID=1697972 RepID=A0ABQ4R130_9HYPH|nr:L,D-transpeptidase [Methylobacterium crusticola]GJD51011.1 hypothetical protein OPKNFCMD_3762 [Methylobacterium crusticola]
MDVRGVGLAAFVAVLAGTGPGLAQGAAGSPAPGAYGGGFIEFLMTGRDASAVARPLRPAPVAPDGTLLARAGAPARPGLRSGDLVTTGWAPDPMVAARPQTRLAALPEAAEAEGLARAPDPRFARQEVAYDGGQRPGTVVIDTPSRFLYLVQPGGRAIRYGIGVGRPGFSWSGLKTVSMKREWPDWTPPAEMLRRRPDLPRHMEGGPANPLGARALYLGSSLYRIHGTNEPHTIGQSVSSGCIRMMNQDVVDLYERVPVGATVMVL